MVTLTTVSNQPLLTGLALAYAYEDNQRTNTVIGITAEVVFVQDNFEKIKVRIEGAQGQYEQINAHLQANPQPTVVFKNLVVRPYVTRQGTLGLSATADGIGFAEKK